MHVRPDEDARPDPFPSRRLRGGRGPDALREGARSILRAVAHHERAQLRRLRIECMREQVADGIRAHAWLAALEGAGYALELESEEGFVRLRARPPGDHGANVLTSAIHSPTWWESGEETLEGQAERIAEHFAREMRRTWEVRRDFEPPVRRA